MHKKVLGLLTWAMASLVLTSAQAAYAAPKDGQGIRPNVKLRQKKSPSCRSCKRSRASQPSISS